MRYLHILCAVMFVCSGIYLLCCYLLSFTRVSIPIRLHLRVRMRECVCVAESALSMKPLRLRLLWTLTGARNTFAFPFALFALLL